MVISEFTKIINPDEFKKKEVSLDAIFLDPNNPRFIKTERVIPDSRITEDSVQKSCIEKVQQFEIEDLKESIKRIGFLPIDKIVVRHISKNEDNFVVVEGNRRITAMKMLKSEYDTGEIELNKNILDSISKFDVLIYSGKERDIAWLIQGIRHISGVKDWPPYQQSKLLAKLIEEKSILLVDAAKSIGIGLRKAGRLLRSYYGYQQCLNDEEYGEYIGKEKFSFFQEAIFSKSDTSIAKWLQWDDKENRFKDIVNLRKFMSWITESEGDKTPKISRALDVRDILEKASAEYPELFKKFVASSSFTIEDLRHSIWQVEEAPQEIDEWVETLSALLKQIENLPDIKIKNSKKKLEIVKILTAILDISKDHLQALGE